jgi:hypothetical protein
MTNRPLIELYEDNGGGLYLRREGSTLIYGGMEQVAAGSFEPDAAALAADDMQGWRVSLATVGDLSATTLVATWDDGSVSHVVRPDAMGHAARRYIGIEEAPAAVTPRRAADGYSEWWERYGQHMKPLENGSTYRMAYWHAYQAGRASRSAEVELQLQRSLEDLRAEVARMGLLIEGNEQGVATVVKAGPTVVDSAAALPEVVKVLVSRCGQSVPWEFGEDYP